MTLNFLYNWPTETNHARISFGSPNVEDPKYLFRIGVIKKGDESKVYWQGPSEWFSVDKPGSAEKIVFDVERGDKIILNRKYKDTEEINLNGSWDTDVEWPAEAQGDAVTTIPFYL